ncbi:DUF5689 domain-containing protein [Flagellimonas sp. CMM7]|uniref:DUF5689 domain-containing protein n=1 Tax=Flagellimonas sp. CMM7 TaxID=2654676 RepID=UPI0013D85650|nr:DUF5689 domain-containing protein [Flagellimonas sp. CMM7]UII81842.1 DUF5689 domain-containing protein [Flagellimonas sp. CMM7]
MAKKSIYTVIVLCFTVLSCVKNSDFNGLSNGCTDDLEANATFKEVEALFKEETIQIKEDWIIEGYVISSDKAGNFFGVLHFQDHPTNPAQGFQIEIDLRNSHLFFEAGSKILIKLKGLYLGKRGEVYKLGGTFAAFGNISVGRLPVLKIPEHIFLSCNASEEVKPVLADFEDLEELKTNTLVRFEEMEVVEEELGNTFAVEAEETEQILQNCSENSVVLVSSGFSDFQADIIPEGNGTITGVLLKDGDNLQLVIRGLGDIEFTNDRCPEIITEFASTRIFISELADPDNNAGARFVELYNSATEPLDLNKWELRRYTNANTDVSSTIDLSGIVIDAESTLVISPNATEFELVYSFAPDFGVSTNSPADSNGDDNLELVDPFGTVVDTFGVIGEDGSNTNHEFEDGRALRNANVTEGNPSYTFEEWSIFNDTGDADTTNQPKNAPEDFTPGIRD